MGYTSFVYRVYSNLNSTFNLLNDVISIFDQQKHLLLEAEPCDVLKIFLRFWPFEPHFLVTLFL